ncbi:MAG TPA: orotidine-5'-phosphate decarboxylase [Gemmatimonadota bacterium]|nr:orotidine-5'-phosphate decarboxylase [Gemmatimonadota bacterium]
MIPAMSDGAADRIIVALDHPSEAEARACVEALQGVVGRFKVGSVLFTRAGPPLVRDLVGAGHAVFLDLKLHDTPATVAGAVAAAADLGVDLLTLHAAGGPAMLAAARAAADEAARPPRLLAVTVLTSLDAAAWARVTGPGGQPIGEAAEALAALAREAGVDGMVSSPREVAGLRAALGSGPLLVVPGIRPEWSASDHAGQARTATPAAAIGAGADYLVVGRAITAADDARASAVRVIEEVAAAPAPREQRGAPGVS